MRLHFRERAGRRRGRPPTDAIARHDLRGVEMPALRDAQRIVAVVEVAIAPLAKLLIAHVAPLGLRGPVTPLTAFGRRDETTRGLAPTSPTTLSPPNRPA